MKVDNHFNSQGVARHYVGHVVHFLHDLLFERGGEEFEDEVLLTRVGGVVVERVDD